MSLTATEIAAYIGAAAWLPPIAYWLHGWLVRPRVQIAPEMQVELGFTSFGPIFNIRLALSSCRKDAIVDRAWVELRHEGGELRRLVWTGLRETFSEIIDPQGNRHLVERDQPAIALKLTTALLTEKFVRFQYLDFHDGRRSLLNDLTDHVVYLRGQGGDFLQPMIASRQFFDLLEFYKTSFWWKPGKYVVQFGIEGRDNAELEADTFAFELTQYDVDALRFNVDLVKVDYENTVKSTIPDYQPEMVNWTWRNIPLVKL